MMKSSDSSSERLNDFSQVQAFRTKNEVSGSRPIPPHQHHENVPRIPVGYSTHRATNCDQSSNFAGFLQTIDFSVPPPFPPPVLPGPVFGAQQISFHHPHFNPPNSASPSSTSYEGDPKQYHEEESFIDEKILLRCRKKKEKPRIQLHNFSDKLKNFHTCLVKFKNDLQNLNSDSSQLDSAFWSDEIANLSFQRATVEELKKAINVDSASLSFLKYKLKKRLKKRKSRRRRNLIETKSMTKYEIASLHMQQLQQIVDKQKQEEKFKIEADAILFSVRQKKSEANGQIQFLTALAKLHAARINATNAQNKPSLYDAVCGFNKIIDKLKSMWQCQMKEYLTEENGLNIMVKDLAVTVADQNCSKMKETCSQWLKLLFGTTNLEKDSYFLNYDELIGIRRDWDKYVVDEEGNSSKIPAGWVVPKYPRNDAWSKFVS